MRREKSEELYRRAVELMPGGVNSPVRAFAGVGGSPIFISKGSGSHITDADNNTYVDFVCSWGPLIFGHAHPRIVSAISSKAKLGTTYGASTELEVEIAQMITKSVPSVEMVRLVNSGTEAVMSAIRLARGFTRRDKIIKFEGCYHGHSDSLLSKAGSGVATLGIPDSAGVPPNLTIDTITLPYNNSDAVEAAAAVCGKEIACIIVEPVAGNMGVVPPKPGFLKTLREATQKNGILLIFDEVITGFRLALGGAQEIYGITPDITTMGKILGGGMPLGAYGGRRDIMQFVAPIGPVYQAGTLSGSPIAAAAGIETLKMLSEQPSLYDELEEKAAMLEDGISQAAAECSVQITINRVGSMMTVFFTDKEVFDYQTAKTSDTKRYAAFFWAMLERGFYLPPSQFEAMFVSAAHTKEDILAASAAAREAFAEIASGDQKC